MRIFERTFILHKQTKILSYFILLNSILLSGCSTPSDSIILGSLSGAGAGAAIGSIGEGQSERTFTGAAIGAAVGGLGAFLIHKGLEKREDRLRRETLLNLEKYEVSVPQGALNSVSIPAGDGHALTRPVVDVQWIETNIEGDKLIEGHRIWRITEKSKWLPDGQPSDQRKAK